MRAMILAAGGGERMRPLTDTSPKPLLKAAGKPLLHYHLAALARAGFEDIVINHGRLGRQIEDYFADGRAYGLHIAYSAEGDAPLETAGGIKRALALLGKEPFLVINGDIWTDYALAKVPKRLHGLGHLVLVDNPPHHRQGDFTLQDGLVLNAADERLTYSGIAVFRPELFAELKAASFPLAPLLRAAIDKAQISGEHYPGRWMDIGTPERLHQLDALLNARES